MTKKLTLLFALMLLTLMVNAIEVQNDDGLYIDYTLINNKTELAVRNIILAMLSYQNQLNTKGL
jgi:hypothetical protein